MSELREWLETIFKTLYDVPRLVAWAGIAGMAFIVFAETGLLVGFFLPGDSLLITAGIFAAKGDLNITMLCVVLCIAAIVGDATGYWIGKRAGGALYNRPESFWFRRKHLLATKAFYDTHGGKTIVIARFMPFARTFAPVVAGIADMGYRRFATYNIFGGVLWVLSMCLGGYFVGQAIPDLEKHIHLIVIVIIALSLIGPAIAWWKSRK
ncbi:MAG TPA: VTT domain-containing protein [Vicinamibacterales bacterium]|nr:VTT domain-containing protein [Vicinamibacterales bacterium]